MSHKIVLRLCFSVLLLGAGTSGGEELNGILGEAVAFRVKTSTPFVSISWSKIASGNSEVIAVVTFGETCGLTIPNPAYGKRVSFSVDCRDLHLSQLKKEDAGRFTAEIVRSDADKVVEFFDLQIFRRLLDSEIRVTCPPNGTKNGTWHLNCSTEPWEDRVNISWTSPAQSTDPTSGSSVVILQDLDHNFTCTAENPVSTASKRVSSKQVCAEKETSASKWWIGFVVVLIALPVGGVTGIYVRKRRAAKRGRSIITQSEIENPARSDSTFIRNQPKETRRQTNPPARRAGKTNQETPHTIYSAVQHPKPNPLQTDDEKIRKGRRGHQNQEERTVYSEITKPPESEDPSIKTIYETVQTPPVHCRPASPRVGRHRN